MAIGATSAFRPTGTVSLNAGTTSANLPLAGGGVRITFDDPLPMPEYVLGILEAIVQRGGRAPVIEVYVDAGATLFDVRWT